MSAKRKNILCIEDSAADRLLVTSFLSPAKCVLHFAEDGEQGRDFLLRQGRFCNAARPDMVLLDLNLPRYNGRQILEVVKADPQLKLIPVIVLTTSTAKEDVREVYRLGANAYFTKPVDLNDYEGLLNLIESHWVTTACLPDA